MWLRKRKFINPSRHIVSNKNLLLDLPSHIMIDIFHFIDGTTLQRVSAISSNFYSLVWQVRRQHQMVTINKHKPYDYYTFSHIRELKSLYDKELSCQEINKSEDMFVNILHKMQEYNIHSLRLTGNLSILGFVRYILHHPFPLGIHTLIIGENTSPLQWSRDIIDINKNLAKGIRRGHLKNIKIIRLRFKNLSFDNDYQQPFLFEFMHHISDMLLLHTISCYCECTNSEFYAYRV